uniref:DNA-directed RNA polymerase subunit n=1 Tax=Nothobranchius kadleci TaxID=1051664 RepID=A0A1A8D5V7_NOTKA
MANFEHAVDDPKHVDLSNDMSAAGAPVKPSSAPDRDAGCVVPSFAAASELLPVPYSCLVLNSHRRHVALAPQYLNKKKSGIQEELDGELLKFSQSLNGVLLAYDNIRILGRNGDIYNDSGYIHMDIEASFIVFQPKRGQKLLGKVNKLGVSHVGCLVHSCFNASIPRPTLVSIETWRDAGPKVGTELEFKVTALDADAAGVLLIRGQLGRTRVQELLAISESSESRVPTDKPEPQDAEPSTEPTQGSSDDTPRKKKKKKKKKNKIKEEETEGEIGIPDSQLLDSNTAPELNITTDEKNGGKKKKKKKKEKHLKEEEETTEREIGIPPSQPDCNATPELNGTRDETSAGEKKKKKKEKHFKEEEEEMEIRHVENFSRDEKTGKKRKHDSEDQTPVKSKKRRKD